MGSPGRPPGAQNKDKRFRAAIVRQLEKNPELLDNIAAALCNAAAAGDNQSIKEVGDRLDGKVAQPHVGDSDEDPIQMMNFADEQRVAALQQFFAGRVTLITPPGKDDERQSHKMPTLEACEQAAHDWMRMDAHKLGYIGLAARCAQLDDPDDHGEDE